MSSNVKDGLSIIFVSALIFFNCIYLGFFVNLKGEEAEITKIEYHSSEVQCYLPKYLGWVWVMIPDNNYKKGDKITIPVDSTFLDFKNVSTSIGIVYYCTIFVCIFFFIGGFITMCEE